jgi:hypothetical protein
LKHYRDQAVDGVCSLPTDWKAAALLHQSRLTPLTCHLMLCIMSQYMFTLNIILVEVLHAFLQL